MDIRFTGSQAVEMAVAEQPIPIQHYLRQPHRIVNALAASSRIESLSEDVFRLTMRPLTFMMLTVQPTVDLRVWSDADGTVHVRSVACHIRGMDYINQRFTLNLIGKLQPCLIQDKTHLTGRADLEVRVELPPPLLFTPKPLLEATGNGLLKSVLLTIKQRLMHHLLSDYYRWAQGTETPPASAMLPTNSPIA